MAHTTDDEQVVARSMRDHIAGFIGQHLARSLDDAEGGALVRTTSRDGEPTRLAVVGD